MRLMGGAALALAVLLAAGTVHADARAEREARALFKEANRLLREKDYVAALDMYRAAYGRWPNPKILLNIGTTLRNLGRDAEAADAYERYLVDGKPDAKRRTEVQAILKEITARLGKLRIEVNEPGARVLVDGKVVGESPQAITKRVEPGTHTVVAEKQGYPAAAATVQIAAGQERVVELRLVQPGPPSPTPTPTPTPGPPPKAAPDATPEEPPTPPTPAPPPAGPEGPAAGGPVSGTVAKVAPPRAGSGGRFGAFARADVDGKFRGAAGTVGASYGVLSFLDVWVAGIIGPKSGLALGGTAYLLKGRFRPLGTVAVPLLFADGARPGVHVGVGAEYAFHRNLAAFLLVGLQFYPTAQTTDTVKYEKLVFVPSLGLQARL
jgi:hypothetical protein